MRAASQLRIFATLLVLAAWAVVLRGLYFLPALGITLLLIGLLLVGLRARHVGSLAAGMAACLTLAFGFWTLTQDVVLDILPGLDLHLWFNIGLSSTAILIAVLGSLTGREASGAPAS
jgi:hypothetical protein